MLNSAHSLRTKILGFILGISLTTLAVMVVIVILFIKPKLELKLEKRGMAIAHAISAQCINPILTRKLILLDMQFLDYIRSEKDVEYIYVIDPAGEITAHSFGREFPVELKKLAAPSNKSGHETVRIVAGNRNIIDTAVPILDGSLGWLHIGMSAESIKTDVNDLLRSFLSIAVLFAISALLLLLFLNRAVIRPISAIKEATEGVGEGDFSRRALVSCNDEIGSLASAFNKTLESINESRATLLHEKQLLTASEAQLKKIIALSPIAMALVAMDGTIEYLNDYAVDTFGYLPADIPHMNDWWHKAYPDESYRHQVITTWLKLMEKAQATNSYIDRREYLVTCKNGTIKTMVIFGVIIGDKCFVMFEDISERKEIERQIQRLNSDLENLVAERTAELQRINRDLASFCYAVSHELHAPAARLKGLSRALQELWQENTTEAEYCVKRIEVASSDLQRVINSVLQLSRLSQLPFKSDKFDLSAVAHEIIDSLVSGAPERQVEAIIAEHITAKCDPVLVRLCLENLLGNAFKYSSRLTVARLEFGFEPATGAYFVRDNGIGFDMKNCDNLFEPFIRLHQEDEFAGSGIGLATVQRIIERHGGLIWAESSPGQGATFYFTLTHTQENRHDA